MRLLVFITLLLSLNLVTAQTLESSLPKTPQESYDFHIKKKRANNTAGWITFGGGIAMILGGIGWNMSGGILDNDTTNNKKGLWLSYLGGAVTLVSVPLFISAGSHKRKAKVYLSQGAVGFNNQYQFSGIGISFSF